jgi:type IV secretory pathway VirB10-like protein
MDADEQTAAKVSVDRQANGSEGLFERIATITRSKRFGLCAVVGSTAAVTAYVLLSPDPTLDVDPDSKVLSPQDPTGQFPEDDSAQLPNLTANAQLLEPELRKPDSRAAGSASQRQGTGNVLAAPTLIVRPRILKLTPGLMGKAVLVTGASNGPVKAKLTERLVQYGEEILEAGSILLGSGNSSNDRLTVQFDKVLTPDGAVTKLKANALDKSDMIAGLKGSVAMGRSLQIAGGIGLNVLGGFADGLQENEAIGNQVARKATLKNAALNGTSKSAFEEARNMMSRLKENTPTIEVAAGKDFFVLFEGNEENN